MRVVVTGASGFVGGFVCRALESAGVHVVSAGRATRPAQSMVERAAQILADSPPAHMRSVLHGAEAVVHLAAAVHDMHNRTNQAQYQLVNHDYPLRLAEAAAHAQVKRFVFVSSIKVNGERTANGTAFREPMQPSPHGPYAQSKWQAEEGLRALSSHGKIQTRIVRPPLVYGPGVRANFLSMMRWVKRGLPLPFGGIHNARSLVYVENLADVLARLALGQGGAAPSSTYLVCDGEDLSTGDLVRRLAVALDVAPRLFRVPELLLRYGLVAMRKGDILDRLVGSLRVDASLVRRELAWSPPHSVDVGLARTAAWFNKQP
jgi:nucleoside-diphosphate-sugar epimerase